MRVVGVAIEKGALFLAAAEASGVDHLASSPIDEGICRIEPNMGLDDAHRLVDLTHRIEGHLRAFDATKVALARTRKFAGLSYADALVRVSTMCAVMAASVGCELEFVEVTTEAIAKRVGGVAKSLEDVPASTFGFKTVPKYWRAGVAKAFGAGATLLPRWEPK
jgi:hypothetical protein